MSGLAERARGAVSHGPRRRALRYFRRKRRHRAAAALMTSSSMPARVQSRMSSTVNLKESLCRDTYVTIRSRSSPWRIRSRIFDFSSAGVSRSSEALADEDATSGVFAGGNGAGAGVALGAGTGGAGFGVGVRVGVFLPFSHGCGPPVGIASGTNSRASGGGEAGPHDAHTRIRAATAIDFIELPFSPLPIGKDRRRRSGYSQGERDTRTFNLRPGSLEKGTGRRDFGLASFPGEKQTARHEDKAGQREPRRSRSRRRKSLLLRDGRGRRARRLIGPRSGSGLGRSWLGLSGLRDRGSRDHLDVDFLAVDHLAADVLGEDDDLVLARRDVVYRGDVIARLEALLQGVVEEDIEAGRRKLVQPLVLFSLLPIAGAIILDCDLRGAPVDRGTFHRLDDAHSQLVLRWARAVLVGILGERQPGDSKEGNGGDEAWRFLEHILNLLVMAAPGGAPPAHLDARSKPDSGEDSAAALDCGLSYEGSESSLRTADRGGRAALRDRRPALPAWFW